MARQDTQTPDERVQSGNANDLAKPPADFRARPRNCPSPRKSQKASNHRNPTMVAPRRYQHTFGRSAQTKILDAVRNNRKTGINIRQLSKIIGQSYFYTVALLEKLERRGLVTREPVGNQSIIRPNPKNPIVRAMESMRN